MQSSNKGPRETLETLETIPPESALNEGWMTPCPLRVGESSSAENFTVTDSTGALTFPPSPTPTPLGLSIRVNTRGEWEQFRIFPFKFIVSVWSVVLWRKKGWSVQKAWASLKPHSRDCGPAVLELVRTLQPFRDFKPSTKGPGWPWYLLLRKSPTYKSLLKGNVFSCEKWDTW